MVVGQQCNSEQLLKLFVSELLVCLVKWIEMAIVYLFIFSCRQPFVTFHFSKLLFDLSCQMLLLVSKHIKSQFKAQVKADRKAAVAWDLYTDWRSVCILDFFCFISVKVVLGVLSVVCGCIRGADMDWAEFRVVFYLKTGHTVGWKVEQ